MAVPVWILLVGVAVGAKIWGGQQYYHAQEASTVWFSDPYQFDSIGVGGTGQYYTGPNPPGEAPPWRLASETELVAAGYPADANTPFEGYAITGPSIS
jgi:hypothetical protein